MRGRTNIPPRLGGIVNGVVREYQVMEESGISIGDYVQFVGATDKDLNNVYYGSVVSSATGSMTAIPFGVYKLPDGKGIYFGIQSSVGLYYGLLTLDEAGMVSGVSLQTISLGTGAQCDLSVCEIKEGVFLVSGFTGGYQNGSWDTMIVTYKNGTVSVIPDIQKPFTDSWKLLLGAAVISITGDIATMVAFATDVAFTSSSTQKPTGTAYGIITFTLNITTGEIVELAKLTHTNLTYLGRETNISPQGFWNDGMYAIVVDSSTSSKVYSCSVSEDGLTIGDDLSLSENIARGERFDKIADGVYCRMFVPASDSYGLVFYSSKLSAWQSQVGETYGGVHVQIMKVNSNGVSISNGGNISFDVPEGVYTPSGTSTSTFAVCLGGGGCAYLGGNKIMVVIPVAYSYGSTPYSSTYQGGTIVAIAVGIVEYDVETGVFSSNNHFDYTYAYDFDEGTLSFLNGFAYFFGRTLPGFVKDNKCNFVAFYGGRYNDLSISGSVYPRDMGIQGMSFAFEGREIVKPSDTVYVKKYTSRIAGVAKTSGGNGEYIEVYSPE